MCYKDKHNNFFQIANTWNTCVWFDIKYFQLFGCIKENALENIFNYLIVFLKMIWKTYFLLPSHIFSSPKYIYNKNMRILDLKNHDLWQPTVVVGDRGLGTVVGGGRWRFSWWVLDEEENVFYGKWKQQMKA